MAAQSTPPYTRTCEDSGSATPPPTTLLLRFRVLKPISAIGRRPTPPFAHTRVGELWDCRPPPEATTPRSTTSTTTTAAPAADLATAAPVTSGFPPNHRTP